MESQLISNDGRITVLHSVPVWLPQTETWIYNQVRYLPAGIESHIFCESTENLDQFPLANVHSLSEASRWRYYWDGGLRGLRIRRHFGYLAEQARRHHVEVLHSHFGNVGWADKEVANQEKLWHVVTFYGVDASNLPRRDPRWHDRYRELFEQVDQVLCEGPHMARCLVELGCPDRKVRVHHLGVSIDDIAFRPRMWTPDEPLRVLIAASFREKKGIPYALKALARLKDEVSLEITVIGDANDQPKRQAEKGRILATIERHGLQSMVRMLGFRSHAALFAEAYHHHIFLSPSVTADDGDTEGGAPVTIIEMAATGMPVVSTTHCDIPELIHHNLTGLLAEEGDVEGLVGHLRWLIQHPDRWGGMSEAGRKHVESEFNARVQGERLGAIYQELKARHR